MNIFWATYEPAMTDGEWKSSTGDGMWLQELWASLRQRKRSLYNLSVGMYDTREDEYLNVTGSIRPDVLVLSWRWSMPTYPSRQAAYLRQQDLLTYAMNQKVPVLIHNSNLMPDIAEARQWAQRLQDAGCRVKLTAPLLNPPPGYETLHFVMPQKLKKIEAPRLRDRVYIGNNYGRYKTALEWLANVQVAIYGNWLEESPHRESPEQVLNDFGKGPLFMPKLDQKHVLEALAATSSTVHLAKPDYYEYGFVAYRWAEAAQAGTYAFVPFQFQGTKETDSLFSPRIDVWKRPGASRVFTDWRDAVAGQREYVQSIMSVEPWHQALEELAS